MKRFIISQLKKGKGESFFIALTTLTKKAMGERRKKKCITNLCHTFLHQEQESPRVASC
jgi:hypothetical protein